MRRMIAVSVLLAALQLTGCSSSVEPERETTTKETSMSDELVRGYSGGCEEGFTIYVQNQFTPYGSQIRRTLDQTGEGAGLFGNEEMEAVGWTRTELVFYPDNPAEIQGTIWFYVLELPNNAGSGWLPDAGVRAVKTDPAPGDEDKYFDPEVQAVPQLPVCELLPR